MEICFLKWDDTRTKGGHLIERPAGIDALVSFIAVVEVQGHKTKVVAGFVTRAMFKWLSVQEPFNLQIRVFLRLHVGLQVQVLQKKKRNFLLVL